jgi:hypothetical protein
LEQAAMPVSSNQSVFTVSQPNGSQPHPSVKGAQISHFLHNATHLGLDLARHIGTNQQSAPTIGFYFLEAVRRRAPDSILSQHFGHSSATIK